MPEVDLEDLFVERFFTGMLERQALFLDDIETDDAEITHIVVHESGDVVVPHEQEIDRHVLAIAK